MTLILNISLLSKPGSGELRLRLMSNYTPCLRERNRKPQYKAKQNQFSPTAGRNTQILQGQLILAPQNPTRTHAPTTAVYGDEKTNPSRIVWSLYPPSDFTTLSY